MDPKIAATVREIILEEMENFKWNILGFVDESNNIYPMTSDTKVLSKVFEMKVIPHFVKIAEKLSKGNEKCKVIVAEQQNQYPDITLTGGLIGRMKIAIDMKSAYRKGKNKFSGFTLGAFNGYFKNRQTTKNITYPYDQYSKHWILCFIYDRDMETDTTKVFSFKDKGKIPRIITNVEVILQEKWKVAKHTPGSGNTANIGGIDNLEKLKEGEGPFSSEGKEVFDDYWMHYVRKEDCNKMDLKEQPFKNLETYKEWVREGRLGENKIKRYYKFHPDDINSESDEE